MNRSSFSIFVYVSICVSTAILAENEVKPLIIKEGNKTGSRKRFLQPIDYQTEKTLAGIDDLPGICLFSSPLEEIAPQSLEISPEQFQFLLPINWASSPQYTLVVSIPQSFTPLHGFKDWADTQTTLMEFVPKGESGDGWTEILTLNKYIDQKISAKELVSALKKRLLLQSENGKIWEEEKETSPAYSHASLLLSYDFHGKHEVLGMEYFSGPYDCVGIQYTVRPSESTTDQETIEKIKQLFNHLTKIH